MKSLPLTLVLAILALLVGAGCGDDDDGSGGGQSAPDADSVSESRPQGEVTWCIGKDTTGAFTTVVENFNREHPEASDLSTMASDATFARASEREACCGLG